MGSDSIPLWIIFITCVIGGAYFAAAESSFSGVNKIKMKTLADDGNKRAKGVLSVLNKFEKALSTLLIGNNVTKIVGAAVFTILATDIFKEGLGKIEQKLPEDFECQYSTMGGWAIEMLDADPSVGKSFRYKNLFVIVSQMDEERVTKLTVLVEEIKETEVEFD